MSAERASLDPAQPSMPTGSYRTIVTIGCDDSSRYSASNCSREVALTVHVSERYLPSREERISIDALSKSGAWRRTTSRIACANPSSVRPTIFIGKAQGNSSKVSVISIGPIWGRHDIRASPEPLSPLASVHVLPRRRVRQAAIGKRLADEELEDRQPAAIECVRRAREINAPDTKLLLSDFAPRRVGVRLQPVEPIP